MARILRVLALVALSLVLVQSVSAASIFDSFNKILGGNSLGDIYENHGLWIDFILYLFLFIYVARFAFERQQGAGSFKPVSTVLGVAMAVSVMAFEWRSGFRIGNLGPFLLALALVMFGWVVYKFIRGMGVGGTQSFAWAYVGIYAFLATVASPLIEFMQESDNEVLSFVGSVLNLVLIAAIVGVIYSVFKNIPRWFGGGGSGGGGGGGAGAAGGAQQAANNIHADQDVQQAASSAASADKAAADNLRRAEELEAAELKDIDKLREFLDKLRSTHLDPAYAKKIADEQGNNLKAAIRLILNYHKRALENIVAANKLTYAALTRLKNAMRELYSLKKSDLRSREHMAIMEHLQNIVTRAMQDAKDDNNIEHELAEIKKREEEVVAYVDELVELLASRDSAKLLKVNGIVTSAFGAITAAELGVEKTMDFARKHVSPRVSAEVGPLIKIIEEAKTEKNLDNLNRHKAEIESLLGRTH